MLTDETGGVIWRRYSNYNLAIGSNLIPNNLPSRITLVTNIVNESYTVSTLSINGVTAEDFTTYECSWNQIDRKNLTEARKLRIKHNLNNKFN